MTVVVRASRSAARAVRPRPARAPCRRAASGAASPWRSRQDHKARRDRDRLRWDRAGRPGTAPCRCHRRLERGHGLFAPDEQRDDAMGKTTMSRSGRTGSVRVVMTAHMGSAQPAAQARSRSAVGNEQCRGRDSAARALRPRPRLPSNNPRWRQTTNRVEKIRKGHQMMKPQLGAPNECAAPHRSALVAMARAGDRKRCSTPAPRP